MAPLPSTQKWPLVPIKRFAQLVYGDALPAEKREDGGEVLVYGSNGPFGSHSLPNTAAPVVLVGRKGSVGALNWSDDPAFAIDTVYFVDEPNADCNLRWLYWALQTAELHTLSQDTGVPGLSREMAYGVALPLPHRQDQAAIAAFLDRETGKIDALVEEQRRLIELLKEKRQAVISHAVTKGLDPKAKMKPSGAEWLGDVPEHWEVVPLKWLVSHVVDCLHTTPTYEGELRYPAVRTADVERGVLLLEQARLVSEEVYVERIQRLKPEAGDILYSREGERFGMAALVPSGVDLCLGQRMMMFRVLPHNSSAFLMWTLNSEPIYQQVLARTAGATAPHANIGDVVNFRVPCPSGIEQRSIADHLADQTSQIDALISEAASASTLLVERRASLISAAVTGKIDVRKATTDQEVAA